MQDLPTVASFLEFENFEGFIHSCQLSSNQAYDNFKSILDLLESQASRSKARRFLAQVEIYLREKYSHINTSEAFHFSIERLATSANDEDESVLTLLQLPSIFSPEEWSFTFYEGLARYPVSEFHGRVMAELGCGNGWISIALAQRTAPLRVYGLDINPRAIVCAKINLYLNAIDNEGELRIDESGKSLLDRVEFHTSDLLAHCREKGVQLDRIIGCIPQVLSPDPNIAMSIVPESSGDEFLYSLSNYCSKQGYIEDQFGLGLIARAVEEAVELMKPSAKIVLNLGGRPGHAVLKRLFERRGFHLKTVWQTKVIQAEDTDIEALVEIENATSHRFEFYMGLGADEPISAQTAQAYAKAGGTIAHSLTVVEATLSQHSHIKKLFKYLNGGAFQEVKSALDLSFQEEGIADEKIPFLGSLTDHLQLACCFPYDSTEGQLALRRHVADYLRSYWRVPLTLKSVLITPSRLSTVMNILALYKPARALIDAEIAKMLPLEKLTSSSATATMSVIEAPRRVDLVCKLIETLRPEIVVTSLSEFEVRSQDSLVRLIDCAHVYKARLFIDISPFVNLSSAPDSNAVFQRLCESPLPAHVSIFFGLVKNMVYADLEIGCVLSENASLLEGLSSSAELTYSRVPLLAQIYYDRILSDLLNFRLTSARREKAASLRLPEHEGPEVQSYFKPFDDACVEAFKHPAITSNHLTLGRDSVRLDYGENALPSPTFVKRNLLESFVRQNISASETELEKDVALFLQSRFGIDPESESFSAQGLGVAPLFAALAEHIARQNGLILFPSGAYGHFIATCAFYKTQTRIVTTHAEAHFKYTPKILHEALKGNTGAWLFLNAPVVNPTGAVYSFSEFHDLLAVARSHNAKVIMDCIFSGLEFNKGTAPWNLEESLRPFISSSGRPEANFEFVILGGISKEFAAGGLRYGFAYTRSAPLAAALRRANVTQPHPTLRYAVKRILAEIHTHAADTVAELSEQRRTLQQRACALTEVLEVCHWQALPCSGGLFLVASASKAYYGKSLSLQGSSSSRNFILGDETLADALFYATGLLINGPKWTGIPGYCRFVLSVEESEFQKSLERLRKFKTLCLA